MNFKPSITLSIQGYEVNHDEVTTETHIEQILSIETQYWHPITKDKLLTLAEALVKSHKVIDIADIEICIGGKTYLWEISDGGIFPIEQDEV